MLACHVAAISGNCASQKPISEFESHAPTNFVLPAKEAAQLVTGASRGGCAHVASFDFSRVGVLLEISWPGRVRPAVFVAQADAWWSALPTLHRASLTSPPRPASPRSLFTPKVFPSRRGLFQCI